MRQALPVVAVANWNARAADMHREMIASRALARDGSGMGRAELLDRLKSPAHSHRADVFRYLYDSCSHGWRS